MDTAAQVSMDIIHTWIQLLHGSYTYLDSVAQEALRSLYSPGYRCSRGSMDPILTWIPLLKRLHGSYTHLDTVVQEAPYGSYTHQNIVVQEAPYGSYTH